MNHAGAGSVSPKSEDEIRDFLAEHLELIEPGLGLIDKEQCLPNDKGAKGFVDLFTRSASGHLVIIEIKRSNASARQCLHELSKYAALLRENFLVKSSEFRLLVLSTDWHELLVPFAEFVQVTRYNCAGYEIELDKDGLPASVLPVLLPELAAPRRISGRHFIWEFMKEENARRAIPLIAAHMQEVGLKDFVLLLMDVTLPEEGDFWLVYFAQQRLTLETYMELIKRRFSGEDVREFESWLNTFGELEDRTEEAADKVWDSIGGESGLFEKIDPDGSQISHPDKARYWFQSDRLESVHITRFGRFDDPLLKDDTIIAELVGSGGESDIHVDIQADFKSKPEIDALLSASDNAMYFNAVWKNAIRDLCSYAQKNGAQSLHLKAFSNDDILRSIAGLAIGRQSYMPIFSLEVRYATASETFVGLIEWNGTGCDFSALVKKHFDGDPFHYSMMKHFGVIRGENSEIMDDLGLEYAIGRAKENDYTTVRIQGSTIKELNRQNYKRIGEFVAEQSDFVAGVIGMLISQEQEFSEIYEEQMLRLAEAELESRCDIEMHDDFWLGTLAACNLCKRAFDQARYMIDGGITEDGPWGCLCAPCFISGHGELGWGKGQLYKSTPDGWRLVAGGPPSVAHE